MPSNIPAPMPPSGSGREPGLEDPQALTSDYEERYWRTSLKDWCTIIQKNATQDYRLRPKDLDGLLRTRVDQKKRVGNRIEEYYYYKYKEEDVLRQAWRRYGGPDGFWNHLKKLRNAVGDDKEKLHAFDVGVPTDYRQGGYYDITKPFFTPPRDHPYHRLPLVHKSAYDRLGPRRYDACVDVLQYTEWPASPNDTSTSETMQDGYITDATAPAPIPVTQRPEADTALEVAVDFFAAYPSPPEKKLKSTSRPTVRAINEVREVLKEAPTAPSRTAQEWGRPADKLDFVDEPAPGRYEWNSEYLQRVFESFCALIERDPSTWEAIRWEIYTKYLSSVSLRSVLRYDAMQLLWFDEAAAAWLAAQLPPDELWQGLRGKCAGGERYNELLGEYALG